MAHSPPHLFVDISSHGFGHLAQTAPVLNCLAELLPGLRLTLRSGLPAERLRQRIVPAFGLIAAASDFGYVMHDAMRIDHAATAAAYRAASADFSVQVERDARLLRELGVDAVFTNVSYVPLAGASRIGIPAVAMCSLNWADLFLHYFGSEQWAAAIHAEMLAAYRSATFLRTTPGMPMTSLDNVLTIGPIAGIGCERRVDLRERLGAGATARIVLAALGGIPTRLPVESWPVLANTHWLVPAAWNVRRPDISSLETFGWPFADLLRSADAVLTKPGYGTFAEAAANGTAVLYQRRDDWPEQDCLIQWLHANARCAEIGQEQVAGGQFADALATVIAAPVPPRPAVDGVAAAAAILAQKLGT
ncbi:MAG: hypothetical protein KJ787_08445 [Gammaproteobacteria bacterium]|nr:hypothetical protein [Gammaproteobacteria bacterium]MBU1646347.1 hypothetical protein [Gammaproteobacteria bacterium]MBU1970890.1 hypothetical protein [Gammaproteobacteria bacterium]